jgi:hypothetical protein
MAYYSPLLVNGDFHIVMMKATASPETDGSWSNTDGSARVKQAQQGVVYGAVKSLWAVQDGTTIHIATQQASGRVAYHAFSTSTDAWTTVDDEVFDGIPGAFSYPVYPAVSIGIRTDGDKIVGFAYASDGENQDIYYSREEGSGWQTPVAVADGDGTVQYYGVSIVRGASDRMHFHMKDYNNGDGYHRSLSSANVLDTLTAFDSNIAAQTLAVAHPGISYVSGGTQVKVPYLDSTGKASSVRYASGANPSFSTDVDISDSALAFAAQYPYMGFAVDGTTTYLMYVGADSDVWRDSQGHGGSWGTDVEVHDAVTAGGISVNSYTDGGSVVAYLWDDNGTLKYGIITLAALDQEGYRWRDDDGSETAASWLQIQDSGIARNAAQITRLRIILNATGDNPAQAYQLEYKESNDPAAEWRKLPLN